MLNRNCGCCAAVMLFAANLALSEPPAVRDDSGVAKLEEIVVTAQKRVENLQQVPISAQIINAQTLAEQNYNSLDELTETVPGVHLAAGGGSSNDLFIRGVGSGENPSFDQSVAIFDDDIYFGRSRISGATFLDLDRIEVLKGPQSTYFGNNAIAGALNIVTKKPGDTFDASARVLYGMHDQYAAEGAVTLPISDILSARLAITRNGEGGWITNVNTGQKAPDENNEAARLTLALRPNADLDVTLKIEGSRDKTSGTPGDQPFQYANCPAAAPVGANGPGYCALALALGVPIGLDSDRNSTLPGQYSSLSNAESVLTINYQQWGQTFTSVSGFYNYHFNLNADGGSLPTDTTTNQLPESYHQFSQELRVASSTGGSIEYLAGAYFQTDQLAWDDKLNLAYLNPVVEAIPPFAALIPYLPVAGNLGFSQGEKVYSVFGSFTWNATDRLKVTAGLRGSRDDKNATPYRMLGTGTQLYGGFVPLPPAVYPLGEALFGLTGYPLQANLNRSDQDWTPSARIQYQIAPETRAYFSFNKGFKAGGINGDWTSGTPANLLLYGPEYVRAYELGLKSKWFDESLLLNLAVFRSDYQGLQVDTQVYDTLLKASFPEVGNAADSRSQGIEIEGQWAATKDFRLSANVTYLDAYYISYSNAPSATLQNFCAGNYVLPACSIYPKPVSATTNLAGQPLQYSPRWSGSVTARYGVPLPGDYKFTTELSPYFTSRFTNTPGDAYFPEMGGYVRLDGRLTLEPINGRWAIDLIGKNLTNRTIITNEVSEYLATKEQPFNIAVQFRYHL